MWTYKLAIRSYGWEYQKRSSFCTNRLSFKRCCFEVISTKSTLRPLGVKGKTYLFFWHLGLHSLGNVSQVVASRSSSKITRKLNLQFLLNIELFPAHMELGKLGVFRKLVKDVVHQWRRTFEKLKSLLPIGYPNNKRPLFGFKKS
jgi:hypothetical protein